MNQTIDWRAMEAGQELDCLIAKQLGWHFVAEKHGFLILHRPDHRAASGMYSVVEDGAWQLAWQQKEFPQWSMSVDTALTLPLKPHAYFALEVEGKECECQVWYSYNRDDPQHHILGSDKFSSAVPALVICQAWLSHIEQPSNKH